MILAGGLSTRLYPLTRQVPKPLVPVAGEPNSAHVLRYLKSFGIEEVAINVHYLAGAIEAAFGDGSRYGVQLTYLHEPKLMGSAGSVKTMEPFFDDTFVVVGCDDLTDIDLARVVAFHRERQALATIALVHAEDVTQYGVVILDDRGKIVDFQEKPARGTERSHLVNTGIYVFEPAIFAHIPANEFYDFGKQVFPSLQVAGAPFYGLEMPGAYWRDVGTIDEYRATTADVLAGRVVLPGAVSGIAPDAVVHPDATVEGRVRIGARTTVGAGARITGPCLIGSNCTIGPGASLVESVVGDRGTIGANAAVERSVLWDGVRVGDGASVAGAIVGIGYEVAPRTRLDGHVVANEAANVT